MNKYSLRTLQRACGISLLLAAAPLAGAQTPTSAPKGAPTSPPAGNPAAPGGGGPPLAQAPLTNDQASYLFGLTFGEQLHGIGLSSEVVPDAVARGIKDALQGKKSTLAERQQVQEYARARMVAQADHNKTAAQEFLAKNGHEKGVITTASGLQYKVLTPGNAKAPAIATTDEVTVNYRGKLLDGTEFDSSYSRGTPATFPVTGVIKGWTEALVLMKPGAKWELFVPPELAYGPQPRPQIPSNSLLIFEVEVISAKPGSAPPAAARPGATPPSTSP
jgi:FKBP-type peptidyl-prolyl cis-trans isomerase